MASLTFVDFSDPKVDAAWLNDVNGVVYNTLGGNVGQANIRSNLGLGNPAAPAIGDFLVGNGGFFENAQLVAGTNVTITQGAGTVTIAAVVPAGFAPIASPAFTGNPTAPTPAPGDNDTSIATTAFVTAAVAGGAAQAPITMQDEGVALGAAGVATTINFTGAGVTASLVGSTLTVNAAGGGGGAGIVTVLQPMQATNFSFSVAPASQNIWVLGTGTGTFGSAQVILPAGTFEGQEIVINRESSVGATSSSILFYYPTISTFIATRAMTYGTSLAVRYSAATNTWYTRN